MLSEKLREFECRDSSDFCILFPPFSRARNRFAGSRENSSGLTSFRTKEKEINWFRLSAKKAKQPQNEVQVCFGQKRCFKSYILQTRAY
jgi:hypothetical protein